MQERIREEEIGGRHTSEARRPQGRLHGLRNRVALLGALGLAGASLYFLGRSDIDKVLQAGNLEEGKDNGTRIEVQGAQAVETPDGKRIIAAEGATPTVAARTQAADEITSRTINKGETVTVQEGAVLGGDLLIGKRGSGKERFFDNDPNTAQMTLVTEEAEILAPYGGFMITNFPDEATRAQVFARVIGETIANGCVNGCPQVNAINWRAVMSALGAAPAEIDIEMKPGETREVVGGSIAKGDVTIIRKDGSRQNNFDSDPNTGAISEINETVTVFAQWGANISYIGFYDPIREGVEGTAVEDMKRFGCTPKGCNAVTVYQVGEEPPRQAGPGKAGPVATATPAPKIK